MRNYIETIKIIDFIKVFIFNILIKSYKFAYMGFSNIIKREYKNFLKISKVFDS